jgi:hypothetical protein
LAGLQPRGGPPFSEVLHEVVYQKNTRLMVTPEVPAEGLEESTSGA